MSKTTIAIDSEKLKFNAEWNDVENEPATLTISGFAVIGTKGGENDVVSSDAISNFFAVLGASIVGMIDKRPQAPREKPLQTSEEKELMYRLTSTLQDLFSLHDNQIVFVRQSLIDALSDANLDILADDLNRDEEP